MWYLFVLIGFAIGCVVSIIMSKIVQFKTKAIGCLDIDKEAGLCEIHIYDRTDLHKQKKVFLDVNPNATISREEQSL